jgi:hypothetical protein
VLFRCGVVMGRNGFAGANTYFSYPLLPIVHGLRTTLYARTDISPHKAAHRM